MSKQHISWPENEQKKYAKLGYWQSESLPELLQQLASKYGKKTAVIDQDIHLSYQALNDEVLSLASGFHKLGISDGNRVLVQLPNSYEFIAVCFALHWLGALPVLIMPAQRQHDISTLCQLSEAIAYIVPDKFLGFDYPAMAEKVQADNSCLQHIIVAGDSDTFTPLAKLKAKPLSFSPPNATDTALLLLSGGTTGTPKLIPRTHTDYIYNAKASAQLCQFDQHTVYLASLPIAHNFPLACPGILGTLCVGGKIVMAKTPGSDETFSLIEQHKVTATALVPPLVQLWLTAREWDTSDLSSLQLLQVGGARFEPELAKQVTPKLGCQLQQVFGMAEGLLCYTRLDDPLDVIINTQGRPLCPDDEIRIIGNNDLPVANGEVGELQTKGPYTLKGYYRADEHNAKTFTTDGFYQTGDLVRMTANGNLVVEGRKKEQINRAGEKISVAEIENLLSQHPQIEASTLVPIPDEHLGERSCAFIITTNRQLNLQDVQQFLTHQGIARYKLPDQLEQLSIWPLTAIGKIDKKLLVTRAIESANKHQGSTMNTIKHYSEQTISVATDGLELALKLVQAGISNNYALYEHNEEWAIGLEQFATIRADNKKVWLNYETEEKVYQENRLCNAVTTATQDIPVANWRAYGTAKFEMSHVFYQIDSAEKQQELLKLFVPMFEIRINNGQALIRSLDESQLTKLVELVKESDKQCALKNIDSKADPIKVDIESYQSTEYKDSVKTAIEEIKSGQYQKIILSRRIPLSTEVSLPESYRLGRKQNTPARSFLVHMDDVQIAGFSPETVVEVNNNRWVSTQPLAGTRALGANAEEEIALKKELLSDTKEIAEHAVSVKLAQEELSTICDADSIQVSEFMAIRRRGSVQHLASRVKGKLTPNHNAWHAFEALFPAVTASGIPKKPSIEAISRHEPVQREWYSGCVMIIDSEGCMDAALVLRSIFQKGGKLWLQAGAGIVDQSQPERELQETIEKLSCLSQHLFPHTTERIKKTVKDDVKSTQVAV